MLALARKYWTLGNLGLGSKAGEVSGEVLNDAAVANWAVQSPCQSVYIR